MMLVVNQNHLYYIFRRKGEKNAKTYKSLMVVLLSGILLMGITVFGFADDISLPPDALPASEQILYYPLNSKVAPI